MLYRKRVLVIGGSGFIGKTLVPSLLVSGYDVTLLNRGNRPRQDCTQLIADRNVEKEVELVSIQCGLFDAIVDTSAYTLRQTQIALRFFAAKTTKWIHLSSAAVYKNYDTATPHEENDEIGGAEIWGTYGKDKSEIDQFLNDLDGPIATIILRPPYIYGPHNDVDRETFIWSRAENKMPIILPKKAETPIQFLHVGDLADCIGICIDHSFKSNVIYNVASAESVTIRQWVDMLLSICTRTVNPQVFLNTLEGYSVRNHFPFRDYPCCLNLSRIRQDLNWRAKNDLYNGFSKTYSTYTAQDLKIYLRNISTIETEIAAKLVQ